MSVKKLKYGLITVNSVPALKDDLDAAKLPSTGLNVELHVHLDGALRLETIWELLKAKNHPLPGRGTLEDLRHTVQVQKPKDLMHFLSGFQYFAPAYVGDLEAIERIAYEFCEDEFNHSVAYVEARFSPHLMAGPLDAESVVKSVLKGFARGGREFGIKARTDHEAEARAILCCIRGRPEKEYRETLELCDRLRDIGVAGIDIAGDEGSCVSENLTQGLELEHFEKEVFTEAKKLGVRRTVHAGEAGPAESVRQAIFDLHAERIGHGYNVVENEDIYKDCLERRIHFECCPTSSLVTGAVGLKQLLEHPILQFAADDANFSINSDDPTITGTYVSDEYDLLKSWGLNEAHFIKANFNALRASFMEEAEKEGLRKQLLLAYGIY